MAALSLISEHRCFEGEQRFYAHESRECATEMRFSVYLPPQARMRPVPVLYYLAGLTCTEETFMTKAGAQRLAAELGLMLVAPDTSPRKNRIPGDDAAWDFGLGAGFYVDATQDPWSRHYRMYSYVTRELPEIAKSLGGLADRQGIFGHSMGGHGALVCALRNPAQYRSVSAFAPIAAPSRCPWGEKAFTGYLGPDRTHWMAHDASALAAARRYENPILIDQGTEDGFLAEQLKPQEFETACRRSGTPLELRFQKGYDHGYYFISTFMADHLRHHARYLGA
ncbi:S-formylglutathione hydrolase [Steroidobacter denitrificans]|uniref:S-formylglutathione hydrolase n=1 Tax=Steroidobacter denitrificans TaxID=465721 RepID=A0A127FDC1_STEDE|nr:S-formylglutathione hydrolase [Steroidobacter denitrificans]AMN48386.1 S-formylglutathione hydrolase [Steroidobacter denitrificans]